MAKSLEFPVVFKALLDGGYICSVHPHDGKVCRYTVHCPARQPYSLGHITANQFAQLLTNRVIVEVRKKASMDKAGNSHFYFRLNFPHAHWIVQPGFNGVDAYGNPDRSACCSQCNYEWVGLSALQNEIKRCPGCGAEMEYIEGLDPRETGCLEG